MHWILIGFALDIALHWNLHFNEMLENYEYFKNQQDEDYIFYQYENIEIVELPGRAK